MTCAVSLRGDYSATELRGLASATKNANQSRRLLSLAAVLDGMNRTEAARIAGWTDKRFATGSIASMTTAPRVCWTAGPRHGATGQPPRRKPASCLTLLVGR